MTGAHWGLLAGCAGFAVLVVLLRWRYPRLRASDAGQLADVMEIRPGDEWPGGISDGLNLPCAGCGLIPLIDYVVSDQAWRQVVPKQHRLGVVCLTCYLQAGGKPSTIEQAQVIGVGQTVVLRPVAQYEYEPRSPLTTGARVRAIPAEQWQDQALGIVDQAKADHVNAAMAAVDHPYTHLTAEEAADCPTCSPSGLPRRIEGGDEHG